nr:olfactory receptor 7G1-like [Paramormyrops kingsleyae]
MYNRTVHVLDTIFTMDSFELSWEGLYITLTFSSLIYSVTLGCNLILLLIIATNSNLHQPMYLFLLNLSVNDLIGISAMVPRVMLNMLSQDKAITFLACVIQALCLHIYGGATLLILSVMAFDRYIAICHPLRYHSIMTKGSVMKLSVLAWLVDILLVGVLFVLTLQYPFCRTALSNYYCDNVSILKLTCAKETTVNNIYGLFITGLLHSIGLSSVFFTYIHILITCFRNRSVESNGKAMHTCATHLLVFLIYEFSGFVIVLCYRIPSMPPSLQKFMAMSFFVIPPCINPIIYGVKTKEIKRKLKLVFANKIFPNKQRPTNSDKLQGTICSSTASFSDIGIVCSLEMLGLKDHAPGPMDIWLFFVGQALPGDLLVTGPEA